MRRSGAFHAIFNVEIMGRTILCAYIWVPASGSQERQAMMKSKNVVAELRRDAHFVMNAVIAVVFIGFASLAVAAALYDLLAIRH
jgi:hypothetical protein